MKRGTKKTIKLADLIEVPEDEARKAEAEARKAELGDETIEVAFVGKRKAMKWSREAQALDLQHAKDREKLKDEYGKNAFENTILDEDGNEVERPDDAPVMKARHLLAVEYIEANLDLNLKVLGDVLEGGTDSAEDFFDEHPDLLEPLTQKVLEMHRLEARAGLSSGQ